MPFVNRHMNYYVYVLLDTRKPGTYTYGRFTFDYEPFYIGKGSGNRKLHTGRAVGNPLKRRIIDRIREEGLKPKGRYVRKDLTEEKAFALERKLIALIGRRYEKAGPLANLTAGGEGFTAPVREAEEKRKRNWRKAMDARTPEQKAATAEKLRSAVADGGKERARKISKALTGKKPSAEALANRRATYATPEYKAAQSERMKAVFERRREELGYASLGRTGKKHSEESKRKMSESRKAWHDRNSR